MTSTVPPEWAFGEDPSIWQWRDSYGISGRWGRRPRALYSPARQFLLGEQPLLFCGLLGTDVHDDDVQLTDDGGSFGCLGADLGGRSRPGSIRAGQHAVRARPAGGRRAGSRAGSWPAQSTPAGDAITVRLARRAFSPVLRRASLLPATTVPWSGNRTLRCRLA